MESYGVFEEQKPKHFTANETTCFKHLEKTTTNTNNPFVVGLLWDDDNVEQPDKKTLLH